MLYSSWYNKPKYNEHLNPTFNLNPYLIHSYSFQRKVSHIGIYFYVNFSVFGLPCGVKEGTSQPINHGGIIIGIKLQLISPAFLPTIPYHMTNYASMRYNKVSSTCLMGRSTSNRGWRITIPESDYFLEATH